MYRHAYPLPVGAQPQCICPCPISIVPHASQVPISPDRHASNTQLRGPPIVFTPHFSITDGYRNRQPTRHCETGPGRGQLSEDAATGHAKHAAEHVRRVRRKSVRQTSNRKVVPIFPRDPADPWYPGAWNLERAWTRSATGLDPAWTQCMGHRWHDGSS